MAKAKNKTIKIVEPKKNGRPTKYKPEMCEELITFFSEEPNYQKEIEHYDKEGNILFTDFKLVSNKLPTLIGFARSIGVDYMTVWEWAHGKKTAVKEEFSKAYKYAKELQKWFLIENGLNGVYNATAYIFTAKNIAGMRDQIEIKDPDKDKPSEQFQQNLAKMTREEVSKAIMDQIYNNKTKKKINIPKK